MFQFQKKFMNTPSSGLLYDLAERATAVESMFFIYDHFKYIQFRVTVKFKIAYNIKFCSRKLLAMQIIKE